MTPLFCYEHSFRQILKAAHDTSNQNNRLPEYPGPEDGIIFLNLGLNLGLHI